MIEHESHPKRQRYVRCLRDVGERQINIELARMQDRPSLRVDHVHVRLSETTLSANVVIHYRDTEVWNG